MTRVPLKTKITNRIKRSRREVFLRDDFVALGDYDQVGRALKQLVQDGLLIKIGYGLYAKARPNQFTLRPSLAAPGGFIQVAVEALNRLKVDWEPTETLNTYAQGSTQVPTSAQVRVKERFSRKIETETIRLRVVKV